MTASRVDSESPEADHRYLLLAERLRRAERRAATFRVASAIGHLMGTPLNVIAGRAALIRAGADAGRPAEHARRIEEQVERLAAEVRRLIDYLTPLEPSSEPESVRAVVDDALVLCRPVAVAQGVTIDVKTDVLPSIHVDGISALLVLTTLLSLTLRASAPGRAVELRVVPTDVPDYVVQFELTAPGMAFPRGRIDRLEAPEQPGKADSETLQTLSICFSVAQRHGGIVTVAENDRGATTIVFSCPRVESRPV
jgi:signal transduction histidine kinase